MTATDYLNDLNQRYLAIHRTKEDFFWETYMGISDDHDGSTQAQTAWTSFLSNAEQITAIKQQLEAADSITDHKRNNKPLRVYLVGWRCLNLTLSRAKKHKR